MLLCRYKCFDSLLNIVYLYCSFAKKLNHDWQANSGFITRWKKRYGISNKAICGTKLAGASQESIEEFLSDTLIPKLAQYEPKNIYNADETALFYRAMPHRSYVMKGEKPSGGKKNKNRVTMLQIVNMDGSDKRKLSVIGKAKKPQCVRKKYKMEMNQLPVDWYASKNAWMTGLIFDEIMTKWNRELRQQKRKVLLVLDNASCHPNNDYSNIEILFLIPNSTSVIQPLDQGIILSTKRRYKKRLAERYLVYLENKKDALQMLNNLDIVQACNMMASAWKQVPAEVIQNCFRKAQFKHHSVSNDIEVEAEDIRPTPEVWNRVQQNVQGKNFLYIKLSKQCIDTY